MSRRTCSPEEQAWRQAIATRLIRLVDCYFGSQAQAAQATGICKAAWYRATIGQTGPGPQFLYALDRTGVCIQWVVAGTGPMLKPERELHVCPQSALRAFARGAGSTAVASASA